ncbi:organic solute transporter Ostalpha-domain-containing protein [Flammula alnicola]|nr:organic solute transporter Ostalpha-domain-containing protein [Flammula alnicola]
MPCPTSPNQVAIDESHFWDANGIHWNTHRIGWTIAGGCAALTTIISAITVLQHCRNYTVPVQQRQILRILYMPPVYAIISFCSYRFFREYTYYSFIEVAYEAITLSAFLLLLIDYVAATASGHSTDKALERKDKMPLPIPFCCWRYRPTKAYFMYTVKWSVLQYVIIRPAASIAGIICEKLDILCDSDSYSWRYASVYIAVVDFISISIALYGLLVFYGLTHQELEGRRPMAKFLSIKLIVMFTFYQSFVIGALKVNILKANDYWTVANIKDGLDALLICIEMVFFSALMWWAYTPKEYSRKKGTPPTRIWRPLWDSINYRPPSQADFILEIFGSLRFFVDYARGRPLAHGHGHRVPNEVGQPTKMNFGQAFAVSSATDQSLPLRSTSESHAAQPEDVNIMLTPYPFK